MINIKKIFSGFAKKSEQAAGTFEEMVTSGIDSGINSNENLVKKLDSFALFLLSFILFVAPLFFVPVLLDWFDLPKQSFVLIGSLLILGLLSLRSVLDKRLPFTNSPFVFPALLFVGSAVLSALLSENKILSLSNDPVLYLGLFLLFVVISQLTKTEKILTRFTKALLFSGGILSLLTIGQVILSFFPQFQSLRLSFSPAGSPLSQAVFLAIILPLGAGLYFQSAKSKQSRIDNALLVIIAVGLVACLYTLFRQPLALLPYGIGWKIAANTMGSSLQSAFLGVGPGNFVDAFTLAKSIDFNASTFWNLRFSTSSNFYFYLLTTTGIAGLASFLFLAGKILRLAQKRFEGNIASPLEKGLTRSLLVALILFAILPAPTITLVAFFAILGLLTGHFLITENSAYAAVNSDVSALRPWLRPLTPIVILFSIGLACFHLGKFVLADYNFALSFSAAQNNLGTETYNRQVKAITLNPWNDSYRVSYSQTNLALADTLAGNPNLTDQQKQTIIALVQQAIREGRVAVGLAPKRAGNWENLSLIYRGLINFAQGADQWSVTSQNQAISLDPANPRLRLDLGSVYFAWKDYQGAAQNFAAAANLKPDFANAHYNLAQAFKNLDLNSQAAEQLQLTASLVCAANTQSPDCLKVNAEIKNLTVTAPAAPAVAQPVATPSAKTNLPNAQTKPPVKISSPSGELAQ